MPGRRFFYCTDIVTRNWESGIDHGVRFDTLPSRPRACVDDVQVFAMYDKAALMVGLAGPRPGGRWWETRRPGYVPSSAARSSTTRPASSTISWTSARPTRRRMAFEGMAALVVGALPAWESVCIIRSL